jgi:hypothetical protein
MIPNFVRAWRTPYLVSLAVAWVLLMFGPRFASWRPIKGEEDLAWDLVSLAIISIAGALWPAAHPGLRRIQWLLPVFCAAILAWALLTDVYGWGGASFGYAVRVGGFATLSVLLLVGMGRGFPATRRSITDDSSP